MDKRIIFLDRDGVISRFTPGDYIKSWDEFDFIPSSFDGLSALCSRGYKIYIISNQCGVNKGLFSMESLEDLTAKMEKNLRNRGIEIEGIFYCIHAKEENCDCRKPKTGLLEEASAREGGIDFSGTFFVGDSDKDIQAGNSVGASTVLVLSGETKTAAETADWAVKPDFIAADLKEAAEIVISIQQGVGLQNKEGRDV